MAVQTDLGQVYPRQYDQALLATTCCLRKILALKFSSPEFSVSTLVQTWVDVTDPFNFANYFAVALSYELQHLLFRFRAWLLVGFRLCCLSYYLAKELFIFVINNFLLK